MANKETISRLGTKPRRTTGLRNASEDLRDRTRAFTTTVIALGDFNHDERVAVLAAVAEFYGLTLVVEN